MGCAKQIRLFYRRIGTRARARAGARRPPRACWEQLCDQSRNLASFYREQEKEVEVESLYQRALAVLQNSLGPEHPDVANILCELADLYNDQGKGTEAQLLYERAHAILEKALGAEHPDVAALLSKLMDFCRGRGETGSGLTG